MVVVNKLFCGFLAPVAPAPANLCRLANESYKILWGADSNSLVSTQGKEVFISGNKMLSSDFDRTRQDHIVCGITRQPFKIGHVSCDVGSRPQGSAEFDSLLIRVAMLFSKVLPLQEHLLRFFQDFLREVEMKSSSPGMAEELGGQPFGCEEGAHKDCGIKNDARHALF